MIATVGKKKTILFFNFGMKKIHVNFGMKKKTFYHILTHIFTPYHTCNRKKQNI